MKSFFCINILFAFKNFYFVGINEKQKNVRNVFPIMYSLKSKYGHPQCNIIIINISMWKYLPFLFTDSEEYVLFCFIFSWNNINNLHYSIHIFEKPPPPPNFPRVMFVFFQRSVRVEFVFLFIITQAEREKEKAQGMPVITTARIYVYKCVRRDYPDRYDVRYNII